MSDPGNRNLVPGVQESPMDEAGAGVWAAGDEGAVIQDPELHGENVAGLEVVGRAIRGLGEEAAAVEVSEGRVSEDSDIGPADEGEDDMEQDWNVLEAARQFPLVALRYMFLNFFRELMHLQQYNNHVFVRSFRGHRMARPRHQRANGLVQVPVLWVPEGSGEGAAVMAPEGPGNGAMGTGEESQIPEGSREGALALEPEDQPEAEEEPALEAETLEGEDHTEQARHYETPGPMRPKASKQVAP
ncbi:cancer/testis antigen 47A-like [Saccopteryx leptura]|uniref:cancer/testis antigen 47A-like n=1 Tax=Saccopteryx leptura TaxID=249018 RepID=UPI00339CE0D3